MFCINILIMLSYDRLLEPAYELSFQLSDMMRFNLPL